MKDNRRTVLKAVVMGSGTVTMSQLPARWNKPIVNAIFLPAHATTTTSETDAASEDASVPETTPIPVTTLAPECADCSMDVVYFENMQVVPPSGLHGAIFEVQCVYSWQGTGSSVWLSVHIKNRNSDFSRSYTQCVHLSEPTVGTKFDVDSSAFPGAGRYDVTAELYCESTQILAADQTTFEITQ